MITTAGKEFIALRIGSSLPNLYIRSIGIGDGSGTALSGNNALVNETVRNLVTSASFSGRQVTFQGDFNSVQMSGTSLSEFGMFASGALNVGSLWQREAFGSIVFDGTNELQITTTFQVI